MLVVAAVAVLVVALVLMFARDWEVDGDPTTGTGFMTKLKIVITHLQAPRPAAASPDGQRGRPRGGADGGPARMRLCTVHCCNPAVLSVGNQAWRLAEGHFPAAHPAPLPGTSESACVTLKASRTS